MTVQSSRRRQLLEAPHRSDKGIIDLLLTADLPDCSLSSLPRLLAGIGGTFELAHRVTTLSHQGPPADVVRHQHLCSVPPWRSVLLIVINPELSRVVWVPCQLHRRSRAAGRIVTQDNPVFANFDCVKRHVALHQHVRGFGTATAVGSKGAVAVVAEFQGA